MFTTRSKKPVHAPRSGPALTTALGVLVLGIACGLALSACGNNRSENGVTISSGAGGATTASQGISYNYPYNGEKDVPHGALIRMVYDQASDATAAAPTLGLIEANGYAVDTTAHVDHATVALQPDKPLAPRTQYIVQANGLPLFAFTTAPDKSAPSPNGFKVVHVTPGDGIPFMTFSTLRIRFSEPVDPSTIQRGQGFIFQDSHGNPVPGDLYVQGNNLVFDPRVKPVSGQQRPAYACTHPHDVTRITCDLDPNKAYIFKLDPSKVKSIYGTPLTASAESHFTIHPRAAGSATVTHLAVAEPTNAAGNKVTVKSQLLGTNNLTIDPASADMTTIVSQQLVNAPALGGSVMPMVVRRAGGFQVSPLNVKFGGQIPAGITSGTLHNTFITDLDAYFIGSPYEGGPVTIRMNFDVAVYGDDAKGNGAVNQNVLNVTAVGTARTDGKGHLIIDAMGAFPVAVNAVDAAATNFRLHLAAPAKTVAGDSTPPTIVGQYPSACAYTYGVGLKLTPVLFHPPTQTQGPEVDADGNLVAPTMDPPGNPFGEYIQREPDQYPAADASNATCAQYLADQHNGSYLYADAINMVKLPSAANPGSTFLFTPPSWMPTVDGINDVLPEINPSITFSEPIDPASLHATNGVQLVNTTTNAPVPAALRVQGSTVVVDPTQPLDYNTQYTLSVGTGLTDLAGNALTSGRQIVFHTAPYVPSIDGDSQVTGSGFFQRTTNYRDNIIETAPFLTTLYPGLPCALTGGNFKTGGDTAGYCTGSDQSGNGPMRKWGVFKLPANRAVHMVFSKPVQSSSIVLANGCLTPSNGVAAMASNNGSVAVQIMNSSGQCTGVVAAGVLLPHPDYSYTRQLSIRPASPWQPGQRYWLVVCGSNNADATCVTGKTIVDVDNGKPATNFEVLAGFPTHNGRLNTTPMHGTGTNGDCGYNVAGLSNTERTFYGCPEAGGGPDIVMPFDGAPASQDQFLITQLAPFTDVNGNGFAEGGNLAVRLVRTAYPATDSWDPPFAAEIHLDSQDRERPTAMNRVMTFSSAAGSTLSANTPFTYVPVYDSGAQPTAVGKVRSAAACDAMMSQAVKDMTGTNHGPCAPVTVYPGGMVAQTAGNVGHTASGTPYGRTLLHTRGVPDPDDPARTIPQTAYIVDHCQGTYRLNPGLVLKDYNQPKTDPSNIKQSGGTVQTYDYSPCFVYQQKAIFTSDPVSRNLDPQTGGLCFFNCVPDVWRKVAPQQYLTIDLVGPVSFNRNGRLVINATNTNMIVLPDTMNPLVGQIAPVFIPPSYVTLQLLGPVIHGGPLAAFKTQ